MDEHASKAINVGASIVIALLIIGIVITAAYVGLGMTNTGISQASTLVGQMQEASYTQYDGSTVKGNQVIAIIKQFQDDTISISVDTGSTSPVEYIYDNATFDTSAATCDLSGDRMTASEFAEALQDAQDPTSDAYIAPTRNFTCTVCRSSVTQGITGLYFELQQ